MTDLAVWPRELPAALSDLPDRVAEILDASARPAADLSDLATRARMARTSRFLTDAVYTGR